MIYNFARQKETYTEIWVLNYDLDAQAMIELDTALA